MADSKSKILLINRIVNLIITETPYTSESEAVNSLKSSLSKIPRKNLLFLELLMLLKTCQREEVKIEKKEKCFKV